MSDKDPIICSCARVSKSTIELHARRGVNTPIGMYSACGAYCCCKACHRDIAWIIEQQKPKPQSPTSR